MRHTKSAEIACLLKAWSLGDAAALDRLTPLVYDELRDLAHRYMRHERGDHTLQTTALVNEAYLRLVDVKGWTGTTACTSWLSVRRSCGEFWLMRQGSVHRPSAAGA